MSGQKITSVASPVVQELLKLSAERGHRLTRKLCVVSGQNLVRDLAEHFVFEDVLRSVRPAPGEKPLRAKREHWAEERLLRKIAGVQDARGSFLVGSVALPAPTPPAPGTELLLALDR